MSGISLFFKKETLNTHDINEFHNSINLIKHRGPDSTNCVLLNTQNGDFQLLNNDDKLNCENKNYNLLLGSCNLEIENNSFKKNSFYQYQNSFIIFDGNIYNYLEIKKEIEKYDIKLETNYVEELVLKSFLLLKENSFLLYNGEWSFAIWDGLKKEIILSKDRFGIRPLYYTENDKGFKAVSETKQLNAYSKFERKLNERVIENYLGANFIDYNDETFFNNVFRFSAGSFIKINPKEYKRNYIRTNQKNYYQLSNKIVKVKEDEAIEQLRFLIHDSLKIRMQDDIDYGFALSGGVDSSTLFYIAHNLIEKNVIENKIEGFTIGFPNHKDSDESKFVKVIEKDLKQYKINYINPIENFDFNKIEKLIYNLDFPFVGSASLAQSVMYDEVSSRGIKVLFNGQSVDEVFAGYHHHFYRYCFELFRKGKLFQYFHNVKEYAILKDRAEKDLQKIVINLLKTSIKSFFNKYDTGNELSNKWGQINNLKEMLKRDFDTFQLPSFIRYDDRNSASAGVESRYPFLDHRIVEFGYSLPNNLLIKDGWQKYIMRKAMHEMPTEISFRKDKKGFVTPHKEWINKNKDSLNQYLAYLPKDKNWKSNNEFNNFVFGAWIKQVSK